MVTGMCQGCGVEIPPSRGGGPRKWCGDRCRKQTLYGGTCMDCGTPTNGSNGRAAAPQRCVACAVVHERQMSRRYVLDSIAEWVDLFGSPPTATDWNIAHAKVLGMADRVERYKQTGRPWPSVATAQKTFGSWNAAIAAAGWQPRPVSTYGRPGEDMALCEQVAALYRDGWSTGQLAERFGVSVAGIAYRLKKAGQPRRSLIDAQANRRARAAA